MTYSLILDLVVAGLLVAAIVYMVRLNSRLVAMRNGRAEFEALLARFATATDQAQGNVAAMKAAAESTGKGLQEKIDRARGLSEDLGFLADRANGLADQLERAISRARPAAGPAAATAANVGGSNVARMPVRAEEPLPVAPPAPTPSSGSGLSTSENELIRRLSTLR